MTVLKNFPPKKILIVDDSLPNLTLLYHLLQKNGFQAIKAQNGYECIQATVNQKPDLVLLDIIMPDIDGIEVCRRMRNDSRIAHLPIIFVTAATDDTTLSRAFDAGGSDYIRKPVNKIELLKRIQAAFVHEELMQKNRDEEKLRGVLSLSGTICHEINQPLQYISGVSQLLMMDLEKNTPTYEMVVKMKSQVDRLGEITQKLMQINKIDEVNYLGDTKMLSLDPGISSRP